MWSEGWSEQSRRAGRTDRWEVTFAQVLFEVGYATGMWGKWHLGRDPENRSPFDFGFDVGLSLTLRGVAFLYCGQKSVNGTADAGFTRVYLNATYLHMPKAPGAARVVRDRNHALEVDLMSLVRVHNFSVSLDGFGTVVGQSTEAPFGHAKERLLEWFFGTRTFHTMHDESGGGTGVDEALASNWGPGIGAEIMGRGKFGPHQGPWNDDEWKGWWG